MNQCVLQVQARADLNGILQYLHIEAGKKVALKYAAAFDACFARLETFPGLGAPRPGLGTGVRISVVAPYLVFYEFDEATDVVTVLRIVHGRRKIVPRTLGH